jgi:aspartyl-tRNA(Asn)/glutamyl-tRNA(Gln) amidotransferase subunit A
VPTDGAFPLSTTLDSIGPIGKSVADCAAADAVMAGEEILPLEPIALAGLRFGVAEGLPLTRLDDTVTAAFAAAIARLDGAGVRISRETVSLFDDMAAVNAKGGIAPPEACAVLGDLLKRRPGDIDPNVRVRIERGCAVAPADYADMLRERGGLVRAMDARLAPLDVLAMPTTAIVAPKLAEVADPAVFAARNTAVLRNPSIVNFFDLCAISLPLPVTGPGSLPVGLMLVARNGQDRRLLCIAEATMQLFGA